MSIFSSLELFFIFSLIAGQILQILSLNIGINYGQIANNLPSPSQVSELLQSLSINKVKLYDADPNVLSAFANSNIEFIIGIGNENVANMIDSSQAKAWIQQNVQSFLPQTKITCITVGNEILSGKDTSLMSNLVPAMQSLHGALVSLGLDQQVNITTAHSLAILGNSYPPSSGSFLQNLAQYIQPLLDFHSKTNSPFLINVYPYFAYKASPDTVSMEYVLFQSNQGVTDPNTNLNYDNMLYAQLDSVYSAIKAMGYNDINVRVSETGWPSKGDPDEAGATVENAALYNGNLLKRLEMNQGTPLMPNTPLSIYVFALFNEDLKPGPTSERNYGLFYPNNTPVYNIDLQGSGISGFSGFSPSSTSFIVTGSSSKQVSFCGENKLSQLCIKPNLGLPFDASVLIDQNKELQVSRPLVHGVLCSKSLENEWV
ncbi:Glucan endo-1,3-beta-glucosidase 14 [Dendrobium catenatum]|uniref:glucan endo-1,3-beta-D-glucosidase n=1 Tax=Dendrobium catenatum TaxID=906689 RepID=A0A2I0WYK8_9ASPA|nr:Glucan endo-1,3-beta-glucosidase 14 [Dendrobium catenatum]